MSKDEVRNLVQQFLNVESASDYQVARTLGMTKGNFSKYRDPLTEIQIKTVKAWCFDHYDAVAHLIPAHWRLDEAA